MNNKQIIIDELKKIIEDEECLSVNDWLNGYMANDKEMDRWLEKSATNLLKKLSVDNEYGQPREPIKIEDEGKKISILKLDNDSIFVNGND